MVSTAREMSRRGHLTADYIAQSKPVFPQVHIAHHGKPFQKRASSACIFEPPQAYFFSYNYPVLPLQRKSAIVKHISEQ